MQKLLKFSAVAGIAYVAFDIVARRAFFSSMSNEAASSAGGVVDFLIGLPVSILLLVVGIKIIRLERKYNAAPKKEGASLDGVKAWAWVYVLSLPASIVILLAMVAATANSGGTIADLDRSVASAEQVVRVAGYLLTVFFSSAIWNLLESFELKPRFKRVQVDAA